MSPFTKCDVESAAPSWLADTGRRVTHRPASSLEIEVSSRAPAAHPGGEVVVYEVPDGGVRVDVRFDRETVWLTQQQMAELFGRGRSVVARHVRSAFREGALDPEATSAKFALVPSERADRFA